MSQAIYKTREGLTKEIVEEISEQKNEPDWMRQLRLKSFEIFKKKPMPTWGVDLSELNFDEITTFIRSRKERATTWEELPNDIKDTFDKLGIPEAEKKYLGGASAMYESEVVYNSIKKELEEKGVIFTDTDTALQKYPELVKEYFMTKCVPPQDNKFSALHGALWSGGSFVYIPKGVKVDMPLQIYFIMASEAEGQFEHTLIVAEEDSQVNYIEGCFTQGAPIRTINGIKKIEEIEKGDVVLTHKNVYRNVYEIQKRKHDGVLCTIKYYGDTRQEINITGGHPVLAVKRKKLEYKNEKWDPEWVEAEKLNKHDYLAIPIERTVVSEDEKFFSVKIGRGRHQPKTVEFKLKVDKDLFRLIGYFMAEGSTMGENYLSFTFNKKERDYIEDVKELIERFFGKPPLEYAEYNNGVCLVLCSTLAARFFKQEFGSGAGNKKLPRWAMLENPEKQAEFVKGYWRGDGNFFDKKYSWGTKRMFRICTISQVLAEQTRDILLRLNIFSSINCWKRKKPRSNSYAVYVGGQHMSHFARIVSHDGHYNNVGAGGNLLLKQTLVTYAHISQDYAFVPIKEIKKEHVQGLQVYNFSVEEDESYVSYGIVVHNCTAPRYTKASIHSAVVEIFVKKNARVRYTSVQNWSKDVYNLNTKRAIVGERGIMEWVSGTLGSKSTMLYPCSVLAGRGAKADHLSIAFAGNGQWKDTGAKVIHAAPDTSSTVRGKSICMEGGITTYRGLLQVNKGATNSKAIVSCDALMLHETAKNNTFPTMKINEEKVHVGHEATVGKLSAEKLFYLMTRGLSEEAAMQMVVCGFIEPVMKELPFEYAVELNRLIQLEMTGSVG